MTSPDCPQRPERHAASPHHPRTEDGRDPGRGAGGGGALRQDHSAGRCPQLSHCIFTMLQSDPIFPQTQPLPQQPVPAPVPAVASRQAAGHKHKPPAPIKTRTRGSGAAQVKYFSKYYQLFFVGNPEVTLILLHFRCGRARCAERWRVGTATTVARYGSMTQ